MCNCKLTLSLFKSAPCFQRIFSSWGFCENSQAFRTEKIDRRLCWSVKKRRILSIRKKNNMPNLLKAPLNSSFIGRTQRSPYILSPRIRLFIIGSAFFSIILRRCSLFVFNLHTRNQIARKRNKFGMNLSSPFKENRSPQTSWMFQVFCSKQLWK